MAKGTGAPKIMRPIVNKTKAPSGFTMTKNHPSHAGKSIPSPQGSKQVK